MLQGKDTALVLGAGASFAYGYPLGSGLRGEILSLLGHELRDLTKNSGLTDSRSWPIPENDPLRTFIEAFRNSQMYSVDAFLARRPEFSDIGKKAIAALLIAKESRHRLLGNDSEDHWYQYLFNQIASESWGDLDLRHLKVITFNYDRSLEHFLLTSIMHSYGKSIEESLSKLSDLEIVHVYGSLGPTLPGHKKYLTFDGGQSRAKTEAAAEWIRVIPEGRTDDLSLTSARRILTNAATVVFLGFGFDKVNIERLNAKELLNDRVLRGSKGRARVYASCYRMTSLEANLASKRLGRPAVHKTGQFPSNFYDVNCLRLLRETLAITPKD